VIKPPHLTRRPGLNSWKARCAETMRGRCLLLVLLIGPLLCAEATADAARDSRPLQRLPELAACRSDAHPRLPQHWRATFLMAPFTTGQLVLAEIVHDASLSATRIKLYGVKRGAADFLVAGNTTYELAADGDTVAECLDLGDTGWRPLPQDWLTTGSQCAGSAPVLGTAVD
jgi:hypothetical protein